MILLAFSLDLWYNKYITKRAEVCRMSEQDIEKLVADYAALRSRVAVLEEELALIREQLAWLIKQVFGRKTE